MSNLVEFSVEGLSGYYDSERQLFIADEIGGVDVVEWRENCGDLRFSNVPVDVAFVAVKSKDPILFLQARGYQLISE